MSSQIRTLSPSSETGSTRHVSTVRQSRQGQTLAQQQAAPRQAGGGTIQSLANQDTPAAGMRQGAGGRSTGRERFRAFRHLPLFNKNSARASGSSHVNAAESYDMGVVGRNGATPPRREGVSGNNINLPHPDEPAVPVTDAGTRQSLHSNNNLPGNVSGRTPMADRTASPRKGSLLPRTGAPDGNSPPPRGLDVDIPHLRGGELEQEIYAALDERLTAQRNDSLEGQRLRPGSHRQESMRGRTGQDSTPVTSGSHRHSTVDGQRLRPESRVRQNESVGGQPAQRMAQVGIRLDENRNATIAAPAGRAAQRELIKQTLGHPEKQYQSVASSEDRQQHTLLDDSGRLLSLHSSENGLTGVAASQANVHWARNETPGSTFPRRRPTVVTDYSLTLSPNGREVTVQRNNAPGGQAHDVARLPDSAILSQLSGVYKEQTAEGEVSWRLHEDKLYRLSDPETGWQAADADRLDNSKDNAQLARHGNGQLYLLHDDHQLYNVTAQRPGARLEDKITAASVSPDGQALMLLKNETGEQRVALLPRIDSPTESQRTLQVSPAGTTLAALLQTDRYVIAADHNGQLQVASRPDAQGDRLRFDDETTQALRQQLNQQITDVVGNRFHVQSFITSGEGQLHAIVNDAMDRKHAIVLNTTGGAQQTTSSWNLSDSLVLDFQKGLPQISPKGREIVDLGSLGRLTLHEGKVHFYNETTQAWEASEVKADQLRTGPDGQAWALKDNELKRLKVNVSSNKINFEQNTFSLHLVKKSVSEDLVMPGLDKNQKTVAASMLDAGRFVTLDEEGGVHVHHMNTETRRAKTLPLTLDRQTLNNAIRQASLLHNGPDAEPRPDHKVTDVAIGPDHHLYLLSDKGKMFIVPERDWLKGKLDRMGEVSLPKSAQERSPDFEGKRPLPVKLGVNRKASLLLEMDNGMLMSLNKGEWRPLAQEPGSSQTESRNMADKHYARLKTATRDSRLGNTGITFKREVNTFGQTGHDGHKVHTPFRTRLSTFVFRPTLETPRPLKNLGYLIQHSHSGRQGLKTLYEQQDQQLAHLNWHIRQQASQQPEEALSSKLQTLANRDDLPEWFGDLRTFSATLADSAAHQADLLQQHYGKQGKVKKQTNSLTNSLNPASSRDSDLTNKLVTLFSQHPCGAGDNARQALLSLQNDGVVMSHQKLTDDIPLGMRRDKHDQMGLVKSRLILDGLTNARLHELTGHLSAALALEGSEKEAALQQVEKVFRTLRDENWSHHPVTQVTQQGFTGNDQLEANYDAIKSMTKAFTKANHAVNVTTRTVMRAEDQQALARKLEETVLSMEKGESISFSRAYGAAATVTGMPGSQVIAGVGGRGNLDRNYSLSLTRGEGGVNISFGRDGSGGLTAFSGVGYNVLTGYMQDHTVPVDHERNLLPAIRLGGVFSATPLDLKKQNGVSFDITEAELSTFITGLTEGTLEPMALLNRGINHSVKHGEVISVSLDANAAALASFGVPLTNNNEKDTPTSFRVGGGAYVGANVLSGSRERGGMTDEEGASFSRSNHRLRGANKIIAGANFALPIGVLATHSSGRMPLFAGPAASIQIAIDNQTKQSLSLEVKNAQPVESAHVDKLIESLTKNFSDPGTQSLLASLKDKEGESDTTRRTPGQKLDVLDDHFTPRDISRRNNAQQAALRDLDKHLRQKTAVEKGQKLLQNGEYKTTYANLSKVNSDDPWHRLSHLLDGKLNASNASKIRQLMGNDHQLQSLITTLQDNVSTEATVTLELKDDIREGLAQRWLDEGNDLNEMVTELTNRNHLRLKSISFTKSQAKSDGFATPAFLLGGSNSASVLMKRNLGKIAFTYGEDQDSPTGYTLEGRIAKGSEELTGALALAQQQNFVLKS